MQNIDIPDVNARRAIDAPADAPLLLITGRAASGKTETLARRYAALLGGDSSVSVSATIVTGPQTDSAERLGARIEALLPPGRKRECRQDGRYFGVTLDRLAFDMLAEHATQSGLAYDLDAIDAYDAEEIFERAIAPLFSADWNEFLGPEIDPEIPGLRAPDRFAVAVLRLIRKLRAAQIPPDEFFRSAQRGATAFYANPPNLTAPALLFATKDEHRGALAVGPAELERQRRRELDLAKIIAKVYRLYVDSLVAHGCLTAADAISEATRLLDEHPAIARSYRKRFRLAVVDDVHDLAPGEFRLLQAIFGQPLRGVTCAGDPDAATAVFAGARPDRIFAAAATTIRLQVNYRVPAQIAVAVTALLATAPAEPLPIGDAIRLHRALTQQAEAAFVADSVASHIAAGTPPARIAVVHRSLRTLGGYEDALVDRNIAIALLGDGGLFARHETLDALALLWSTVDPFAHAWLLRVLQMPPLSLPDAALAMLCGEPANPQALLFDLPPQPDGEGGRRWDRRRDLRLGTNVVRGDRDLDLDSDVRERLTAFRARRAAWQRVARTAGAGAAAAAIVTDGGMYLARPGETAARAARRRVLVDALLATIEGYAVRKPGDALADALAYCERIARSETGPLLRGGGEAVAVASIDAVKARRFEHIFVVDVRAGSFPPYYVPDAFLFSPTYGMIPKDSVGEAVTARTAKFTWYAHQAKLRENYSREDRRALTVALARADASATVSVSGTATRGVAAPELFVELQALGAALAPVPNVAAPLPAASPAPALPAAPDAVEPEAAVPRLPASMAAERLVEMLHCVRCAPRRTIAAVVDASTTLLARRVRDGDRQVEERDVTFAFPLADTVVFGSVPALVRHAGRLYAGVARPEVAAAALAITGVGARIVQDEFFFEGADGIYNGPQAVGVSVIVNAFKSIVSGTFIPLCTEHRDA